MRRRVFLAASATVAWTAVGQAVVLAAGAGQRGDAPGRPKADLPVEDLWKRKLGAGR
jgi:hypothetical protein